MPYMIAAYAAAGTIYAGYLISLASRARAARRDAEEFRNA